MDYKESLILIEKANVMVCLNGAVERMKRHINVFYSFDLTWAMSRDTFLDYILHNPYIDIKSVEISLATNAEILGIPIIFDDAITYARVHLISREYNNRLSPFMDVYRSLKNTQKIKAPIVKRVIYHNPATIIYWQDGTKTVVKCQHGDVYDREKGFAMAFLKKCWGNKGNFNDKLKTFMEDRDGNNA